MSIGDAELEGCDVGGVGGGSEEDGLVDGLGLSVEASADRERAEELGVGKAGKDDGSEST